MASYSPPTEDLAIFDSSVFINGDDFLTYNQAVKKFLKYPISQAGTEIINAETTFTSDVVFSPSTQLLWDRGDFNYLITNTLPKSITSGIGNVCLGHNAGTSITTGDYNTAISRNALNSCVSGSNNIAVGVAQQHNISGNSNITLGLNAGNGIELNGGNIAIGQDTISTYSLNSNIRDNIGIGTEALKNVQTIMVPAYENVGVGYKSGSEITTGVQNTCCGPSTNLTTTTASRTTAIGYNADCANYSDSTALGSNSVCTSNNQLKLGTGSQTVSCPGTLTFKMTSDNTSGTYYIPFSKTTAGTEGALFVDDVTGPLSYNPSTASMSVGGINLTLGGAPTVTYRNNCINTVPASPNIFFSTRTTAPSSGTNNVVLGSNAGTALTSGNNNVILGLNAGAAFTSGSSNFALGPGTLQSNVTGTFNVAIGQGAMGLGTGASSRNICIGYQSGQSITTTTNGQNTCIGHESGKSITTGSNVTSVGANANTTGNTTLTDSTAIGANATNANFNSSTAIGVNATNTSANQIMLGTASENVTCPGSLIVTTVDATAVGTAVNLFNNSTTGDINIGNALSSGNITIGPQASGSPSSNITIMPRSGWNGTFQVGDNSSGAKLLCATNLEVNYPISTSITTTPSSARHLGYTVNQSTSGWTVSIPSNTQTNITSVSFTSADYGTYLFEAKIQINPLDNTVARQQILGISTSSGNYGNNTDLQYTTATVGYPMLKVMRVLNIYANTTVYLVGYVLGTSGTVITSGSLGIFSYTRIA